MAGTFCRRCLLKDMSDTEFFESVRAYIQNIPDEQKAPEALYRERLQKCTSCDQLVNGMCALCGCFVEIRAAKKNPALCKKLHHLVSGKTVGALVFQRNLWYTGSKGWYATFLLGG